jgi:DNA-binding protein HU-beta
VKAEGYPQITPISQIETEGLWSLGFGLWSLDGRDNLEFLKVKDPRPKTKDLPTTNSEHSLTVFAGPLYHPRLLCSPIKSRDPADGKERLLIVIKLDIINRVADKTGVPKMKAEQAVEALFHSMKEALTRGERIELRGFGVFVVKPRKRGVGRNPRTGEEVAIPSGKTIRFKPGKELQAHEDGDIVT